MDTKLKKSHKLKNLIIALVVLIPALVLTCLYPQMERAMLDKQTQWLKDWEERKAEYEEAMKPLEEPEAEAPAEETTITENVQTESVAVDTGPQEAFYLQDSFVNYAVEASYYEYAMFLQNAEGAEVFTDVLEVHGWINDYYTFTGNTPYYTEYTEMVDGAPNVSSSYANNGKNVTDADMLALLNGEQQEEARKTQLKSEGLLGYLVMEFDSYGKLSNIRLHAEDNVIYDDQIYGRARESIAQYENNATYYEGNLLEDAEYAEMVMEVCPKNFRAVYLIYEDNTQFVISDWEQQQEDYYGNPYEYEPYYAPYELYFATGAYWIVAGLAIFVFLAAIILPFFKKLETGWEKLFSIPTEIALCIAAVGIALAYGMCVLMSVTTMTEIESFMARGNEVALLGHVFSAGDCYGMLLAVNFLGWALAFFMEYLCAAQLRQFFCGPMYYIKHRLLGIVFIRWIARQCKKLYHYLTDIDIHENLHKSILKIVLANGVIVALLCCIWFAGSFGAVIYSIVLYVLLKKYGSRLQRQYQSILNATGQMAEGDLHITLEEDLGIFAPLGKELEGVQQGFAKAVAEEAKSQNMKSELITNVSHDLKTPLTAIITYVDLLKNPELTEKERQSYIETLDLKSQRLKVLIEDLFEVSKANSGNVKMNFLEVDIVKLMKEVRVEMSDKIEQSNLDFRWNLPEEKVMLSLDGQRTYRIFENLLNNAIKYAMPFTRVYVDIVNGDSEVVITFKNMSAQELNFDAEHLTERFVRGDSSRNSEGSGLGLAIAKSFTELQNGQFDISIDGDLFKVTIRFRKK